MSKKSPQDIFIEIDEDEMCFRCGEPLPLDKQCDCKGSDIDLLRRSNTLRRENIVATIYGYRRTSPRELKGKHNERQ